VLESLAKYRSLGRIWRSRTIVPVSKLLILSLWFDTLTMSGLQLMVDAPIRPDVF
jgi:hypothetical protein